MQKTQNKISWRGLCISFFQVSMERFAGMTELLGQNSCLFTFSFWHILKRIMSSWTTSVGLIWKRLQAETSFRNFRPHKRGLHVSECLANTLSRFPTQHSNFYFSVFAVQVLWWPIFWVTLTKNCPLVRLQERLVFCSWKNIYLWEKQQKQHSEFWGSKWDLKKEFKTEFCLCWNKSDSPKYMRVREKKAKILIKQFSLNHFHERTQMYDKRNRWFFHWDFLYLLGLGGCSPHVSPHRNSCNSRGCGQVHRVPGLGWCPDDHGNKSCDWWRHVAGWSTTIPTSWKQISAAGLKSHQCHSHLCRILNGCILGCWVQNIVHGCHFAGCFL